MLKDTTPRAKKPEIIPGYVVQAGEDSNRFLSRSMRFIKHTNRGSRLGKERAWVHTQESVMRCEGLEDALLYPSHFNPNTGFTEVVGDSVRYVDFINKILMEYNISTEFAEGLQVS